MKKTIFALTSVILALGIGSGSRASNPESARCTPISGTVSTNFNVIDETYTLGLYTGDLAGAVAAKILDQSVDPDGNIVLRVQHYHVTADGDTVLYAPSTAVGKQIAPGRMAVLDYPVRIVGGTGKFKGATGRMNTFGAADFNLGETTLRYQGKVCYRK